MEKNVLSYLLLVLVVLLLIFSTAQAFQVTNLKKELSSLGFMENSGSASQARYPSSAPQTPSMVGGC